MPATYTIDQSRRLVISRIWGNATDEELRAQQAKLRADPLFDRTFRQLIDVRDLVIVHLSSKALSSMAATSNFAPETRRAVLAQEDGPYGMARMFAAHAEASGHSVRVFRDRASAEAWLEAARPESDLPDSSGS